MLNPNQPPEGAQSVAQSAAQKTPFKVYETKEKWQSDFDEIIGSRLKDYRELKEELKRLKEEKVEPKIDTEAIKAAFGEADIDTLMQNERFKKAVSAGFDSIDAYKLAFCDSLIESAAEQAQKNLTRQIQSGAVRIAEVGSSVNCAAVITNDPSGLSDREIEQIRQRVFKGEKIRF